MNDNKLYWPSIEKKYIHFQYIASIVTSVVVKNDRKYRKNHHDKDILNTIKKIPDRLLYFFKKV